MSIFDNLKKNVANAVSSVTTGGNQTFVFSALPESVAEMQALPEAAMDSPFKTAALTVCALCAYAAVPEIGMDMLNFLKGPQSLSTYEKQFLRDRFSDKKYVPFSYFAGAVPDNDYTPREPFTITVESNPYSFQQEGYAVLYVRSGGADSPREIKLRKKESTGQWFLWEQMILSGIREPKSSNPWA